MIKEDAKVRETVVVVVFSKVGKWIKK